MPYKVRKTLGPPSRPDLQGPCVITDEDGKILATMEGFGSEKQYQLACKIVGDGALLEKMAEEIEQLRVQLAGCGVAALSNTHKSREQQRVNPGDYGYSASYQDVFDAVGREMKYRELIEKMAEALEEVVIWFESDKEIDWVEFCEGPLSLSKQALQEYRGRKDATTSN